MPLQHHWRLLFQSATGVHRRIQVVGALMIHCRQITELRGGDIPA